MEDGKPTGAYEDFMTGFDIDENTVWANLQALRRQIDGANGTIFSVLFRLILVMHFLVCSLRKEQHQ